MSHRISNCQNCQSTNLSSLVFLGYAPPVNDMSPLGTLPQQETRFPLELLRCQDCSLVQIGYEVDPEILFPVSYPYLSGTTKILRENFADLAKETKELFQLSTGDFVIDIGANDGTLLIPFRDLGCKVLGIEPSQAIEQAKKAGIPMMQKYFSHQTAQETVADRGTAKIVTAANVFAHIKDVHDVLRGILCLLEPKGVFISESHYLLDLVRTLQYDTVYHEHLRYYSLHSLQNLLATHDLEIIRVKRIPTHGGSIRVYAARQGDFPVDASVEQLLLEEDHLGLTNGSVFNEFRKRIVQSKLDLLSILSKIKSEGKRVYGIGAPSRSSTLIHYTGLDHELIDAVMEVSSSHKLNKFVPGTRIPVLDEKNLYKDQPEFALLFSWHIADEISSHLRRNGFCGKIIVPLPNPVIN